LEIDQHLENRKVKVGTEEVPWESLPEASNSFREVQPRLLMEERDDELSKLVELDYSIWSLETTFGVKP
jgi:hypothetical protein